MKLLIALILAMASVAAFATPEQMDAFRSALKLNKESSLFKAECTTCHTKPPEHNPFGKDLKASLRMSGEKTLNLKVIESVYAKDSDGDGWSNGDEINQGFLPGDPNSHPAGMPPVQSHHTKMMGANMDNSPGAQKSAIDQILPKHSLHPAVVHFPIALFLFGAVLEFAGWRRKLATVREAGWYCVLFGTLSTLLTIPTGFMAFFRNGFQWQGAALIHLILALSATLLMTVTVLWRKKTMHESYAYFALLATSALLVGAAGHFGAQLVYG